MGRLVLTRRLNEVIIIDGHIKVSLVNFHFGQGKILIEAPDDISVHREEVFDKIARGDVYIPREYREKF